MKKLFVTLVALVMTLGAFAQNDQSVQTEKTKLSETGVDVFYLGRFGDAHAMGLNIYGSKFELGGFMNVSGADLWSINLGFRNRWYLGESFFLDGSLGPTYTNLKYDTVDSKGKKKSKNEGKFGLYIWPRLVVPLWVKSDRKEWVGVNLGVRFDAVDFKFDSPDKRCNINIGVSYNF